MIPMAALASTLQLQGVKRHSQLSPRMANPLVVGQGAWWPVISRPLWGIWLVKRGVSRGPIGDGRGPLSLVQSDHAVNFTSLWGSTSTSRTPCHRVPLLVLGPRWELLLVQEWTQPTHRGYGVGGLLTNHHTVYKVSLFTLLLAATAANATPTCCLFTSGMKNGRLFIVSLMEKNAKLNTPLFCTHTRWRSRSAKGICSVDPDCTLHSRNWRLNRQRQWGLSLRSQLLFVMSLSTLFTALELSVFKSWSVRPAQESDCTVTVYSSHVKRVFYGTVHVEAVRWSGLPKCRTAQ